eukprot:4017498-Prymnesium_polylepis.1
MHDRGPLAWPRAARRLPAAASMHTRARGVGALGPRGPAHSLHPVGARVPHAERHAWRARQRARRVIERRYTESKRCIHFPLCQDVRGK